MELTGGQIIVKYLENEGVPYVLGIPGHGILAFFDALRESEKAGKLRYIQVKHEKTAAHIADGYYRVKGEPLAIFTSIGPGALNTTIGLATAYVDSTSFLQISGDTHVRMKGVGVLQEIERYQDSNIQRVFEPVSKRVWRLESVEQLPRIMQRAFNQMLTGRPGPVVLSMPMDVQAQSLEFEPTAVPVKFRSTAKPMGDSAQVAEAAKIMVAAKRPCILVGGAVLRANMTDKLIALAEKWGAPVVTTMAGKSAFPEDHPLNAFHTGSKGTPVGVSITAKADVILALGTRFADETTCSYRNGVAFTFPKTKLIQVDIDPSEIGKNYPCEVGLLGDVSLVTDQLIGALPKPEVPYSESAYIRELSESKLEWKHMIDEARSHNYDKITISQLIGELEDNLPKDTIIATSSGNTQAQLFQEYSFKNGQKHLTTGGFSTMGWALPAAIGAKLAKPDVPVVALIGDGDYLMTIQEMSLLAQLQLPVVVVMANNNCWMAIKDLQMAAYGEEYAFGNDFSQDGAVYEPDYVRIAEGFGVHAEKISKRGELSACLERAFTLGKPAFIQVDVYAEFPASGGDTYGWWDVPVPGYIPERRALYENGMDEVQV